MPRISHQQLNALKEGYLAYRQLMSVLPLAGRFKNFTTEMTAAAIAIESKLAVRGVPTKAFPTAAKKNFFQRLFSSGKALTPNEMVDLAKAANKVENEATARSALKEFLERAEGAGGAKDMDVEIKLLGNYLAAMTFGATWIDAPLKGLERAMGKTEGEDIDYAYGMNKDLVRGTLACDSQDSLKKVVKLLYDVCQSKYAMKLVKDESQGPLEDGGKSKTGYSGWNFAVVFREHVSFAAELQANTYDVLYGKMDQEEYCKQLQVPDPVYLAKQNDLKFPGGLGHGLYEIQDVRTKKEGVTDAEADRARKLSCAYYDCCRGVFRNGMSLLKLNEEIMAFGPSLTSRAAKAIWKHAGDGSNWGPLKQQGFVKPPMLRQAGGKLPS